MLSRYPTKITDILKESQYNKVPLQWTAIAPSVFSQMSRNLLRMPSEGVLPSMKNKS